MFNGIGLRTPRGSGTNGYVQRSLATLPPQRIADTGRQADGITRPMMRADPAILLHERLRSVEVKLMELRIKLEGTMPLEDIEKRINEEREVLLSQLESEKDDVPIKETNESHALAAVKAKQLEVMKRALKIDKEPRRMPQNRSDDPMDGLRDDDEIDEEHSLENGRANRYEDVKVVNGDNNKEKDYSRSHSKVRRDRSHSDRSFVSSSDESSPPRRRHRNPSYSSSRSRSRSRHSYHRRNRHRRRSYTSSRERYRRGRRSRNHRRDRRRSYTPSVSSYSEEEYRRTKRDKYRHRRSRSPINRYSYSSIDSFKDNDRKMSTRKNEKFYPEERKSSTRKNGVKSVEDRDEYTTKRSINRERYSPRNTRRHGSSDRSLSSVSSRRDRTSSSSIEITRGIRPRASSTSSSNMSRSNSRNRRNRRHYS